MTRGTKAAGITVGVRCRFAGSQDETVTVGVLVDSAVVAFPLDRVDDFRPTEVEAVIATLPLEPGATVERIPAIRVDVLAVESVLPGPKVAFGTLSRPSAQLHDLPATSPSELVAAIEQTGALWSAVAVVSGRSTEALTELPDDVVRQVDGQESPGAPVPGSVGPVVRTSTASSIDQLAIDWCWLTPRCAPPSD